MRARRSLAGAVWLLVSGGPAVASAAGAAQEPARAASGGAPPSGLEVMVRVDARPRGRDQAVRALWRLVDRRGRERVRETRIYWRDERATGSGLQSRRLIVLDAPAELRETAFLVWSRLGAHVEDDRWIYLPALRKVRRIAGRDRGNSFLGSDFAFDDLAERAVEEDEHHLLRTETIEGVAYHLVESVPRDPGSPYAKRVHWVDPRTWTVPRIQFHRRDGSLEKTLEVRWARVDGIWTTMRLEMTRHRGSHRTIVEVSNVAYDTGLAEDLFTDSTLRLGVP